MSPDVETTIGQLVKEAFFVDALKKAGPQRFVNLKRGVNDNARGLVHRVGYWIPLCFSLCLCVSVVHFMFAAKIPGIRLYTAVALMRSSTFTRSSVVWASSSRPGAKPTVGMP